MRKKLITGALKKFLCAVSVCTMLAMYASASEMMDMSGRAEEEAVSVVCGLGIMEEADYGVFSPDDKVTRGETAVIVSKLMKYAPNTDSAISFNDVPSHTEEAGYISALYNMGIMSGYSDTVFGYSDNITYDQFISILMRATGYMALSDSMSITEMVDKSGLLKGVSVSRGELTRAEVAKLVYSCLSVKVVKFTGNHTIERGETVLESCLEMEKAKGIVTANSITKLSRAEGLGDGRIEISRVVYKYSGNGADGMLGYPVIAYYDISDDDREIKYIYVDKKNLTETTVNDYDLKKLEVKDNGISIIYEENGRTKNKSYGIGANLLYNGTAITEIDSEMFDVSMGDVKIIEAYADTVSIMINKYQNYIAGYINVEKKTVMDKFDRRILDLSDDDSVMIYKFGYEVEIEELKEGEVLSVYDNQSTPRLIRVFVSDDTENGTLEGIDENGAVINGKSYRIASGVDLSDCVNQYSGIFYLDSNGKIAGVDRSSETSLMYGYLISTKFVEEYIDMPEYADEKLKFKILSQDGIVSWYIAADKIKINDEAVYKDWVNFSISLFRNGAEQKSQMVKYQLDYTGRVKRIYTENSASGGPYKNMDYATRRYRKNSGGMYEKNTLDFFVDSSTLMFSVPPEYSEEDDDYTVASMSSLIEMESYICKPYDMDEYACAKVMLMTKSTSVSKYSRVFCVNSVMPGVNADGDYVDFLKGCYAGNYVKNELKSGIENVKKGDILQINMDGDRIIAVSNAANAASISEIIPKDDFHNDFACGEMWGMSGEYLRVNFSDGSNLSVRLTNNTKYSLYDSSTGRFSPADKMSITVGKMVFIKITTGYALDVIGID